MIVGPHWPTTEQKNEGPMKPSSLNTITVDGIKSSVRRQTNGHGMAMPPFKMPNKTAQRLPTFKGRLQRLPSETKPFTLLTWSF